VLPFLLLPDPGLDRDLSASSQSNAKSNRRHVWVSYLYRCALVLHLFAVEVGPVVFVKVASLLAAGIIQLGAL
jgi:hypothetical protein